MKRLVLIAEASVQAIPAMTVERVSANDNDANQDHRSQSLGRAEMAAGQSNPTPSRAEFVESESITFTIPFVYNLPGPSQVVTHPEMSGLNSNGERQRRRGVSGPPTGRRRNR